MIRDLLLLRLPSRLPQGPVPDINVHTTINLHQHFGPFSNIRRQKPMHQAVTPVGSAGESNILCSSAAANLAQDGAHKLLRVRDEKGRLSDFGHSRGDEVGLDALDADTILFELRAQG